MKLSAILAGTALATLALVSDVPRLAGVSLVTPAEAAINVSISLFYDRLGGYGDWVSYRGAYVFIPASVGANWRPYTLGHWVYTKRYGWTWASDEPFGWATYHYGRWGYGDDIGWYWVPGKRWAPAWVSWRRSKDYVVWAPLPPSRRGGVDVSISIGARDIPDYYWVAVPTRRFLAPDLRVVVVHDDREIRQVVERTRYIGTPKITNNIVINNVIDVNVIAKETGEKVRPVEVRTTQNPTEAKATADQVTVFQGELATDTSAKPQKLSDVNQVKKVKRNGGGAAGQDNTSTTAPATTPGATDGTTSGTQATPPAGASGTDTTGTTPPAASTTTKDTKAPPPATDNTGSGTAPAEQPATGEAATPPAKKDRKKKSAGSGDGSNATDSTASQPEAAPAPSTDQPATDTTDQAPTQKKREKKNNAAQDSGNADTTGSAPPPKSKGSGADQGQSQQQAPSQDATQPADTGNGQKKGKGKKQECDPSTDGNCPPAQ